MLRNLLTRSAYKLYELGTGRSVLSKQECLEHLQWQSAEQLAQRQWAKLKRLLEYAWQHVPYYRETFDAISVHPEDIKTLKDFQRLPLLRREDVQNHKPRLVSQEYTESSLIARATGGSSGKPVSFYQDQVAYDYVRAAKLMTDRWAGWDFGKKSVIIWGHPRDAARWKAKRRLRQWAMNEYFFNVASYSDKSMVQLAALIRREKPDIILAYASSLFHFARFVRENDISGLLAVKGIISSADTLYSDWRDWIEETFQCCVFNRYGSREFGIIAAECSAHEGLHVISDIVLVEYLDDNKLSVDSGQVGHLVITDLTNYAMPFIRYKIEDMGIPGASLCSCGRSWPLMEEVVGREMSVLIDETGNYVSGLWGTTMDGVPGISQGQLIQEERHRVTVRIVCDAAYNEKSEQMLRQRLWAILGQSMHFDFEYVDSIPRMPSGKHLFTANKVFQL